MNENLKWNDHFNHLSSKLNTSYYIVMYVNFECTLEIVL
jgi:hypothetical protein